MLYSMLCKHHILDDYYGKYDPYKVSSEITHLSEEDCVMIHDVLSKYEFLFDVTLGNWKIC